MIYTGREGWDDDGFVHREEGGDMMMTKMMMIMDRGDMMMLALHLMVDSHFMIRIISLAVNLTVWVNPTKQDIQRAKLERYFLECVS